MQRGRNVLLGAYVLLNLLGAVAAALFVTPFKETLPGPRVARIVSLPPGMRVECVAYWKDLRLHNEHYSQKLEFDAPGIGNYEPFIIPTSVAMKWWKTFRTRHGGWSYCLNCYGPSVGYYVVEKAPCTLPPLMKWFARKKVVGNEVQFTIELMPDETKFTERPFTIGDRNALLEECRKLLAPHVNPAWLGPELRRLDPVRVETRRSGSVYLWMGGNVYYSIEPSGSNVYHPGPGSISGTRQTSRYGYETIGYF